MKLILEPRARWGKKQGGDDMAAAEQKEIREMELASLLERLGKGCIKKKEFDVSSLDESDRERVEKYHALVDKANDILERIKEKARNYEISEVPDTAMEDRPNLNRVVIPDRSDILSPILELKEAMVEAYEFLYGSKCEFFEYR